MKATKLMHELTMAELININGGCFIIAPNSSGYLWKTHYTAELFDRPSTWGTILGTIFN